MQRILDDGLDELAVSAHAGFLPRLAITAAVAGVFSLLAPWRACLVFACILIALEIQAWFATRRQFLHQPVGWRTRLWHVSGLAAATLTWTGMGALLWTSGSVEGALCAVLVWMSVIFFAQTNAYQSPTGFVVGGAMPAAIVLAIVLFAPHPAHMRLFPVVATLVIALIFAGDGVTRMLAARRRLSETQAKVRESEARYRLLTESTTDIILRYDPQGVIEFASPSVSQIGYRPEDVVGRNMNEFAHPDERQATQEAREALARDQSVERRQFRARKADGGYVWLEANPSPIRNEAGEVVGVMTALRDVTARRRIEEALRASEARFRMLADHSTDVVLWLSMDTTIRYASPSIRRLGYTPNQVVGRKTFDFVHPDDRERTIEIVSAQLRGLPPDPTFRREYRVLTGDGGYVWLEGSPTIIKDDQGRPTSMVTSYRDVSARRQLEDDLLDAKLRAEAAAEAKAEFLANMSHEIRTPLTGILGFSGLLDAIEELPERAKTYIDRIETSGRSLLAVVNDILDFSKLEAGQVSLDPRPFEVSKLFEQTLAAFSDQAAAKAIELELNIESGAPEVLHADSARLLQVLNNLISNAIKFTDAGAVGVTVGCDPTEKRLRVAVTDTGVGVPADRLDRLFQRFSQVDGSVSRRYGGTGLGLSICKRLVELMGGEIAVFSTVGVGSTFEFWITAESAEADLALADPPTRVASENDHAARVLVVDDLDVNRELIRAILESAGQVVAEAASGADAVEAATRAPFDLIFMDLQMPGMDGFAAARAIRRHAEPNRGTPIVALSANVLPEHVQASQSAGMNDHIGKPILPAELLGAVGRWGGVRLDEAHEADATHLAQ